MCATTALRNLRRFVRVPYPMQMRYSYGALQHGNAVVLDVGRGGMRLRMGRYLRPGTSILFHLPESAGDSGAHQLEGRIVWCEPEFGTSQFTAGLRILHDEIESISRVSQLVHHALIISGDLHGKRHHAPKHITEDGPVAWQNEPSDPGRPAVMFRQLGSTSPVS